MLKKQHKYGGKQGSNWKEQKKKLLSSTGNTENTQSVCVLTVVSGHFFGNVTIKETCILGCKWIFGYWVVAFSSLGAPCGTSEKIQWRFFFSWFEETIQTSAFLFKMPDCQNSFPLVLLKGQRSRRVSCWQLLVMYQCEPVLRISLSQTPVF